MRTSDDLTQDIRYYLGIYVRRARGAHRRYLDAARTTEEAAELAAASLDAANMFLKEMGENGTDRENN